MRAGGRNLRVLAAALLVALSAVLVVACGEGDSTGADTTASTPLSKNEFLKRGNAACVRGLKDKDTAVQDAFKKLEARGQEEPSTKDFEAVVREAVIPNYESLLDDLSQLQPPARDTATVEELMGKYRAALSKIERDPRQALAAEPFRSGNEAAKSYGLESCLL
jgi:hypothetical protein